MQIVTNGRASSPVADLIYSYVRAFATGTGENGKGRNVAAKLMKAAQAPANTTTPTWAAELVQDRIAEYIGNLPDSVLAQLLPLSIRVNAGAGIRVPVRTDNTAASFVAENDAIPVLAGAFGEANLRDRKLGVIVPFTMELAAAPGAAPLVKAIAAESISAGGDLVLLSDDAGTDAAPAGLFAGVTPIAGSDSASTDIAALVAAVPNAIKPVFVMTDVQAVGAGSANLLQGGVIGRAAVIVSGHMPVGSIGYLDAQDLVFSVTDGLEIEQTDQATVHMESDALPIIDGAGAVAAPVTSLFQVGAIAVRTLWPVSWVLRRANRVALLTGAAW
ncbi:phage major capsid protein [Cupriavidus oxalaticus]|uniref:Phage major capsid protein n=1 Tax=Cupriavidus oxalaticus TaxID=96344 RepID=A0A5P3VU40_9BURK|nr:phage major capsid protein [Cupriavidus oxalaticus]QEZ48952.1 phage major capsid protein [Cupriavidus oxalaticus]